MAACWQCQHSLPGTWLPNCTECGAALCWQCGHDSSSVARRFCTRCGVRLEPPVPSSEPDQHRDRKSRSRLGLPISTAAVLLLLAATAIVAFPSSSFRESTMPRFLPVPAETIPDAPISVGDCIEIDDDTGSLKLMETCRKGDRYYIIEYILPVGATCPRSYHRTIQGNVYIFCLEANR